PEIRRSQWADKEAELCSIVPTARKRKRFANSTPRIWLNRTYNRPCKNLAISAPLHVGVGYTKRKIHPPPVHDGGLPRTGTLCPQRFIVVLKYYQKRSIPAAHATTSLSRPGFFQYRLKVAADLEKEREEYERGQDCAT